MKVIMLTLITIILLSTTVYALPIDKTLHFSAGAITYTVAEYLEFENPMAIVISVAAGKEIYDYYNNGTVEIEDILANTLGGLFVKWTIRW